MNVMSKRIDSYAHLGLPRFITVDEFIQVMDRHDIQRAFAAGADTCPDLPEVSRAIVEHGERFRAVGVPLGDSLDEIEESIRHQAACGFLGIRIFDRMIAAYPSLLSLIGDLGLIPWVVGGPALAIAAQLLVDYLKVDPYRLVVAPHFAGAAEPQVLDFPGPVRDLFQHPRFLVIFSRHGAYQQQVVRAWAQKLVTLVGWERILFGSEFPVCLWRNENYQSTLDWVKTLDVPFSTGQQDAFYGGTASQSLWDRPVQPARLVDRKYSPESWPTPATLPLFTSQGIDFPVELHRRLLSHYLAEAYKNFTDYRTYLTHVFVENGRSQLEEI